LSSLMFPSIIPSLFSTLPAPRVFQSPSSMPADRSCFR
jgi:hypothetical protein